MDNTLANTWRPERLGSPAYRAALARILAQFMHGEEVSLNVIPIVFEKLADDEILAEMARILDDEKRHYGMFDAERERLGLPSDAPTAGITRFGDRILEMKRRGDLVGCAMTGSFMLEGIAFSTLMAHREVVEPQLASVLGDIMADEARHITVNIKMLQHLIADDPSVVGRLIEIHREALAEMFDIYKVTSELNEEIGVDTEWFTMKTLFHHAQRIRRLHLPPDAARVMLDDCLRATPRK
jgi:rubrerythrin